MIAILDVNLAKHKLGYYLDDRFIQNVMISKSAGER